MENENAIFAFECFVRNGPVMEKFEKGLVVNDAVKTITNFLVILNQPTLKKEMQGIQNTHDLGDLLKIIKLNLVNKQFIEQDFVHFNAMYDSCIQGLELAHQFHFNFKFKKVNGNKRNCFS